MRRKLKNNNIRKIYSHGNSLGVTLPREVLDVLKWRKGQKLVVKKRGKGILISDWVKQGTFVILGARSATWNPGVREINERLTNKYSACILFLPRPPLEEVTAIFFVVATCQKIFLCFLHNYFIKILFIWDELQFLSNKAVITVFYSFLSID